MIKIERASNGWILTTDQLTQDEVQTSVFQFEEEDEIEAFVELLYEVTELMGPPTSRHSKKRIHIEIKPGDKVEG